MGGGGSGLPGPQAEGAVGFGGVVVAKLMSPVEAARRAAGAWFVGLLISGTGLCSSAWAVLYCSTSTAFTGEVVLLLLREVNEDNRRPA